jgi:hypothetical protein
VASRSTHFSFEEVTRAKLIRKQRLIEQQKETIRNRAKLRKLILDSSVGDGVDECGRGSVREKIVQLLEKSGTEGIPCAQLPARYYSYCLPIIVIEYVLVIDMCQYSNCTFTASTITTSTTTTTSSILFYHIHSGILCQPFKLIRHVTLAVLETSENKIIQACYYHCHYYYHHYYPSTFLCCIIAMAESYLTYGRPLLPHSLYFRAFMIKY